MKKLIKSLLSMVLVLSMCIGLVTTVSAANLTTKDLSEMDFENSTDLYTGVSLLMGLGILKDTDTFPANLGEGISRAHFLEFVMRFTLDGVYNTSGVTLPFKDVSSSASYYGALAAAVAQGIIMEDTNFRPDDYITYEEALTVMFRVYDLDAILDPSLPWPQNYVNLATKLKLYKGDMLLDHDGYLTYEGFFKLMKDVLQANVVEANYTTAGITYTISDEKYHEIWYDVYELEGLVQANGITNISSDGAYKENYLMIDGKYYYSGTDYQSFLGYDVEGFYKEDDFDTIISLSKKYCKELVIAAQDIEGVTLDGDTINIRYDDNGKKKDVQVSTGANVIYNGKSFANDRYYVEWYDISRGSITLVTKNSVTYDTAFINEYESYIVTGVDTKDDGIIYLKDSEPVALEDTEVYTVTKNGKKITLADIVADNIVSLKKAYDNSRLEIIVSEEKFTSPLTSVAKEDKILYFGAKQYEVTSETFINSLILGTNYDVYVDAFGFIVDCVNVADDAATVGYIIAAHYDSWKKTASVLMLKKGDKEPFEYQLADKVKFDGETLKLTKIVSDATADTPGGKFFGGSTEPQEVVIYKFNSEGKLSYIDTYRKGENEDAKTTLCHKIKDQDLYNKNNKFGVRYSTDGGLIAVNKNTLYVNIPTETVDSVKVPSSVYEDYSTVSSVADDKTYTDLNLYTLGTESVVAIAGLFYDLGGGGSLDEYDHLYVVARIAFAMKDDEWVRRLTVVRSGVETQIYVNPDNEAGGKDEQSWASTLTELKVGDAVSYKVDTKNYLTVIKKFYDYETRKIVNTTGFNTQLRIAGGYVYDYEDGFYSIVADPDTFDPAAPKLEVLAKGSTAYIYEVLDRELVYESMSDAKLIKYSSAGKGATIYISKLGYEVNRSYLYYRGQASDEDTYGDLKASFYAKQGATAAGLTLKADASGNITLPYNTTGEGDDATSIFENPGNCEFMGWSDGHGVFAEGSTYTLTNYNVSFYPVWENSYKHSFVSDSQTATGEAPEDIWSIAGESITLPANTFTNIGWEFIGWTDGTNTYQPGTTFLVGEQHVEFKAKWQEARTATFAAPSADYTGTAPVAISKLAGTTIQLPDNTFIREVAVGSYEFQGWKLGETTYQAGDEFTMPDENVEFTAVFKYKGAADVSVATAANVRVQKAMNAQGAYEYTSPQSGQIWHYTNLGNNTSYGDTMYRAIKLDLTQFDGIAADNISSVKLDVTASKIDASCSIFVYGCDGTWTGTDFSTEAIPTIGEKIADSGAKSTVTAKSVDLTSYIKSKLQSGADYAIVFVTSGNSTSKRVNFNGGFRYSSASFKVTTTDEQ